MVTWCARCMIRITGREIKEEYRDPTYPLVMKVRQRRLRWLGHVLRLGENRLVRQAVIMLATQCIKGERNRSGTILMDAPKHSSVDELNGLAHDRKEWNI